MPKSSNQYDAITNHCFLCFLKQTRPNKWRMCLFGRCRAWLRKRGILHLINLIVGCGLYVSDVGFDIYVAIQYAKRDEWWWFAFTLAFVILPFIILNFGYCGESETACETLTSLPRSLVAVLMCYVADFSQWKRKYWDNEPCGNSCYRNCRCQRCENYLKEKKNLAESSASLASFRYLETMSESAPQWCLQNYVMLRQWYFPWYTVLSTVFSFISLAWSITSLEKAEKISDWFEENSGRTSYPTKSLIVFFAWQLFSLLSRLSALVFFAYVFRYYVFVFFGLHITLLTSTLCFTDHDQCSCHTDDVLLVLTRWLIFITLTFHVSGSIIDIFECDYKHRGLVTFLYQIVHGLENILLVSLAVWHPLAGTIHNKHLEIIVLCFVFVGSVLSIIFMALYYQCFHPSKTQVQNCEGKSTHSGDVEQECVDSTVVQYETAV